MKKKWSLVVMMISIFILGTSLGGLGGYKIASERFTVTIEPIMIFEGENESVEIIYDYVFPVHNETVTLTNEGWGENGSYIHVNNSYRGNFTLIADGWTIRLLELFSINTSKNAW